MGHACGGASDAALALAARDGVPFAVSPCCIGGLSVGIAPGGKHGSVARGAASSWLRGTLARFLQAEEGEVEAGDDDERRQWTPASIFALLVAWADASSAITVEGGELAAARQRRAKRVIEIDRLAAMPARGGYACGGGLRRIRGAAMATSNLTDLLVGPPALLSTLRS